jgi:hypothetical protein
VKQIDYAPTGGPVIVERKRVARGIAKDQGRRDAVSIQCHRFLTEIDIEGLTGEVVAVSVQRGTDNETELPRNSRLRSTVCFI